MDKKRIFVMALSVFIAFVFVQSLFFKFTDALIMGKNHGQIDAVTIIADHSTQFHKPTTL